MILEDPGALEEDVVNAAPRTPGSVMSINNDEEGANAVIEARREVQDAVENLSMCIDNVLEDMFVTPPPSKKPRNASACSQPKNPPAKRLSFDQMSNLIGEGVQAPSPAEYKKDEREIESRVGTGKG